MIFESCVNLHTFLLKYKNEYLIFLYSYGTHLLLFVLCSNGINLLTKTNVPELSKFYYIPNVLYLIDFINKLNQLIK